MEKILCLQALVSLLICMRDSHFRMPMVHEFYKIFQGSFGFWSHVLSLVQGMDEYTYDTETGPRNVHKRGHIIPSRLGLGPESGKRVIALCVYIPKSIFSISSATMKTFIILDKNIRKSTSC